MRKPKKTPAPKPEPVQCAGPACPACKETRSLCNPEAPTKRAAKSIRKEATNLSGNLFGDK